MSKEMVNHPKHYNNHPSEIEAIDVIRSMCFNIGNGFKYIYRRNDKNNAIQDLKKAIWYIDDEIERRNKWGYTFFAKLFMPLFYLSRQDLYTEYAHRGDIIHTIINHENSLICARLYLILHAADIEFWDTKNLIEAKMFIKDMLVDEEFFARGGEE